MKNIKSYIVLLFIAISFQSCDEFLGDNIDPNRTNEPSLNTLMPTIQFYVAENQASAAGVTNQYIQQIGSVAGAGSDAQFRSSFDGVWVNTYINIIPNANTVIAKATETNSPHYSGVAKVMKAITFGMGTTLWENMPIKEADNQLKNLKPSYDSQEEVYKETIKLLDEAIAELGQATSLFKPAADDLIYKGDIAKWIRAAHTIKARFLLHLARKNGFGGYDAVLAALNNGIKANADDAQVIYNDRIFNPWHAVALANNTGNLSTTYSATLINLLNGNLQGIADPRLPLLVHRTGTNTAFIGATPGTGSTGSNVVYNNGVLFYGWYHAPTAPLIIISNAEARFIEAEALLAQGKRPEAYASYLAGIRANHTKLGVATAATDAFIASARIGVGATAMTAGNVITEKYKALLLNPEAWNDARRFNYSADAIPGLALPANHNKDLNGQWIQRGVYPTSETTRNSEVATANFKDIGLKMWIFN
jgi:hypothetical protein